MRVLVGVIGAAAGRGERSRDDGATAPVRAVTAPTRAIRGRIAYRTRGRFIIGASMSLTAKNELYFTGCAGVRTVYNPSETEILMLASRLQTHVGRV